MSRCKSNDFTLCFTLKQHTPIIHFQADQKGATLRATELKPKLDRFLIEKLKLTKTINVNGKEKIVPKDEYKSWFINDGKEHLALDYKVRIEPNNFGIYETKTLNYFGNQGSGKKKSPKLKTTFQLEIIVFNTSLKEYIKNHFAEFLATTNFGNRQSKGYGSFYLSEDSKGYKHIETVLPKNTWYLEIQTTDNKMIDEVIKYFWNRFKSGINNNFLQLKPYENFPLRGGGCHKEYEESFVKKDYMAKNITWEKPWLKQLLSSGKSANNYMFVRALFGLAPKFEFKRTNEPCRPEDGHLQLEDNYSISVYHNDFKRIPSPIYFKPIIESNKSKIYILINDTFISKVLQDDNDYTFIVQFNFVTGFKYEKKNREDNIATPNLKLFPPFNPSDTNKYYSIPNDFLNLNTGVKNINNKVNNQTKTYTFDYSKQYNRFKIFLERFCENNPSNSNQYRAKTSYVLKTPNELDLDSIIDRYVKSELNKKFNVKHVTVEIQRINP